MFSETNFLLLYSKQVTEWLKLYLSLAGDVIGYENASVTPYIHVLAYHLPRFVKDETPFKSFTGQGVEKINDTVRSIYHNKCNNHDACKEALLALKRIGHLQGFERQPHQYSKKNDEYWASDIFEQRRKRPRLCVASTEDDAPPMNEIDVDTMTIHEIKTTLKEMGIATRVRREDKLREILRKAISDSTNVVN